MGCCGSSRMLRSCSMGVLDGSAGVGSTLKYGDSSSPASGAVAAAAAAGASSPPCADAAAAAAAAVAACLSCRYRRRPSASWHVSATSWQLSVVCLCRTSRQSGAAMAPSASAASWRTLQGDQRHSTAQHSTAQHSTAQRSTRQAQKQTRRKRPGSPLDIAPLQWRPRACCCSQQLQLPVGAQYLERGTPAPAAHAINPAACPARAQAAYMGCWLPSATSDLSVSTAVGSWRCPKQKATSCRNRSD